MLQWTESSAPVRCSAPHTAVVLHDGGFFPGTTWSTTESTANVIWFYKACAPAWRKKLGVGWAKADMSAYGLAWFWPTKAQFDTGARWWRCDITLVGRSRLFGLPHRPRLLRGVPLTTRTRLCLSSSGAKAYSCASRHAWRAAGAFRKSGDAYPRRRAFIRAARRRCPSIAGHRSVARWPNAYKWHLGDHVVVCFRHTRR